jgi:WbqC-like protein family
MVTAAIMQPYFFPYLGYFQLIASADLFVVYDNIKYTKKGWINRNRILQQDHAVPLSLPLKRGSDFLDICDRELAADFSGNALLNQLAGAYRRAPYYAQTLPLVERIVHSDERNLFRFLDNSIRLTAEYLGILTTIKPSSEIAIDHGLTGQAKVLALCTAVEATTYINAIGGFDLYSKDEFRSRGISLKFIRSTPFSYPQLGAEHVPWLSIVDVLMFNSLSAAQERVRTGYELI